MRGLIEKIESWIWIRPIPSKLENQDGKSRIHSGCLPQKSRRKRHNNFKKESTSSYLICITKKARKCVSSNVKKFCLFPPLFTKSDDGTTKVSLLDSKECSSNGHIFTDIFNEAEFRKKFNVATVFRGNFDDQRSSFDDPAKVLPSYGFHCEPLYQDLLSDK